MTTDDLDVPEELEPAEEPSPRKRQISRSRNRIGKPSKWIKITLAATAAGIAASVIYLVAQFFLTDPRFQVGTVEVQGAKYVTAAEVEEQFQPDQARSVFRVPLERRRRQIEQISWVKTASIRRVLPNQLHVTVEERVPIAFVRRSEGLSLIDQDGVILDSPKQARFHFPVVLGIRDSDSREMRREKMHLFSALMSDLERGGLRSNDVVSEVDLQDFQDARMVVSDSGGTVLLHLGRENFLSRYLTYMAHIQEWKQRFPNLQSLDLRYEGQVVINADSQRELKSLKKAHIAAAPKTAAAPKQPRATAAPASPAGAAKPADGQKPAAHTIATTRQ